MRVRQSAPILCLVAILSFPVWAYAATPNRSAWFTSFDRAWDAARRLNQPLLMHFYADWCLPCQRMDHEYLSSTDMTRLLDGRVVAAKLKFDNNIKLAERFHIQSMPADVLIDPSGQILFQTSGYKTKNDYFTLVSRTEAQWKQSQTLLSSTTNGGRGKTRRPSDPNGSPEQILNIPAAETGTDDGPSFPVIEAPVPIPLEPATKNSPSQENAPSQSTPPRSPATKSDRPDNSTKQRSHLKALPLDAQKAPVLAPRKRSSPADPNFDDAEPTSPRQQPQQRPRQPNMNTAPGNQRQFAGLEGFCPVTLMSRHQWVKGNPQFAWQYKGIVYHLAGQEEWASFQARPEFYAPRFLGCDPVVMWSTGRTVLGSTLYGAYYNQQLYLFVSPQSREQFKANPGRYADAPHVMRNDDLELDDLRLAVEEEERSAAASADTHQN